MFNELSRKRRWQIILLCVANSLFGMMLGYRVRYIHPPADIIEAQTKAWNSVAKYESSITAILRMSDLQEDKNGFYSPPRELWWIIKKSLLMVKAEIIIRDARNAD